MSTELFEQNPEQVIADAVVIEVPVAPPPPAVVQEHHLEHSTSNTFGDKTAFEHAQRVANMLAKSDLVPASFKGNVQNVMIALEMANRIGASPLQVMQNLNVIHGKPSWSSSFIIASINASGRFSALRFEVEGEGENLSCYAWGYDARGEKVAGPKVTMQMAKDEGWLTKSGSKWKTMPELMIRYRAAAFFGRLYTPEILMGMQSTEEVSDVYAPASTQDKIQGLQAKLNKL